MDTQQTLVRLGGAAALISAISAAVALALRGRMRERLEAIKGASESDRARLVENAIPMFDLQTDSLSNKQKYDLVIAQIDDRDRQRRRVFILSTVLMVLLTAGTIVLALFEPAVTNKQSGSSISTGSNSTAIVGNGNTVSGAFADVSVLSKPEVALRIARWGHENCVDGSVHEASVSQIGTKAKMIVLTCKKAGLDVGALEAWDFEHPDVIVIRGQHDANGTSIGWFNYWNSDGGFVNAKCYEAGSVPPVAVAEVEHAAADPCRQ